jgi:hypothetical protein
MKGQCLILKKLTLEWGICYKTQEEISKAIFFNTIYPAPETTGTYQAWNLHTLSDWVSS